MSAEIGPWRAMTVAERALPFTLLRRQKEPSYWETVRQGCLTDAWATISAGIILIGLMLIGAGGFAA